MTIFELFALLRKHLVLVIVLPLVTAAATFGVAQMLPNQYTASTTMYVLSRNEGEGADAALTQQEMSVGQMLTNDVATIIKSNRVKKDVAQSVGLDSIDGYKMDITSSTTTRVITLSVTGKDPEMATAIANATVAKVSEVASGVMQIQSVNVIDVADIPTVPSGPRRLLYTAVGGLAGLFLAVVWVVIRDTVDTRIRNGNEAEEIVGVPVVGHFPQVG